MGFLQLLKMVEDGRIFSSCDTCKIFTSVSLPEFRQHCGCLEAMNDDSMDLIKLSLQEVAGPCPKKRTYTCRDCGGEVLHVDGGSCPPSSSFESIKRCSTITAEELGSCNTSQQILTSDSKITTVDLHVSLDMQCVQRQNCTLSNDISNRTPQVLDVETSEVPQEEIEACLGPENSYLVNTLEEPECPNSCNKLDEHWKTKEEDKSSLKGEAYVTKNRAKMGIRSTRGKKMKAETGKKISTGIAYEERH